MANELRFLDGNLLFVGGSLAMHADCCCPGTLPDCDGLPSYWLVAISNMPTVLVGDGFTGGYNPRQCDPADSYDPWVYCTDIGGDDWEESWRGACNAMAASWEVPFDQQFGSNWNYELVNGEIPNARLTGACGATPTSWGSASNSMGVTVNPCAGTTHPTTLNVLVSVGIWNIGNWSKTYSLAAGVTLFDIAPLVLDFDGGACAERARTDCSPSGAVTNSPTCTLIPNG